MKRRSFLKGMLGAAAAPTVIATDTATGVGPMAPVVDYDISSPIFDVERKLPRDLLESQSARDLFTRVKEAYYAIDIENRYSKRVLLRNVQRIDADIATSRSFSICTKIRMQRDRDFVRIQEESFGKTSSAAQMMALINV